MDYSKFRFDCVVDWIALEVWMHHRHPAWRVWKNSAGAFSYVGGLDRVTGEKVEINGAQRKNTPTTRFVVRVQSPARFFDVIKALETIHDRDHSIPVRVCGIEIAFDAYGLAQTGDADLAGMTALMLRQINRPEVMNSAPRFYSWKGTPEQRYGRQGATAAIRAGKTAMYGCADDDYVVRGYRKDYDTIKDDSNKTRRVELDNHLHRARVEVRLQGAACPVLTHEDLEGLRFESLACFFKFRRPADSVVGVTRVALDAFGSLGSITVSTGDLAGAHRWRARKTMGYTQADALNELARDQLRNLTARWKRTTGRARRGYVANSGAKGAADRAKHPNSANAKKPLDAPHLNGFDDHGHAITDITIAHCEDGVLNTSLSETHSSISASPLQSPPPAETFPPEETISPKDKVSPISKSLKIETENVVCTPTD